MKEPPTITITANHGVDVSIDKPVVIGKKTYQVIMMERNYKQTNCHPHIFTAQLMEQKEWIKLVTQKHLRELERGEK